MSSSSASKSDAFDIAVEQIRAMTYRSELTVREIPAPEKVAPQAFALAGNLLFDEKNSDSPYGSGRFILLHDPDSADQWGSAFRIVTFAQAPLEVEIGEDAFLAEVTWSWLMDALEDRNARFTSPAGTATKTISSGFGSLHTQGSGAQIELRASWTPIGEDFAAHTSAWAELLCMLGGLPHEGEDVTSIAAHKAKRD